MEGSLPGPSGANVALLGSLPTCRPAAMRRKTATTAPVPAKVSEPELRPVTLMQFCGPTGCAKGCVRATNAGVTTDASRRAAATSLSA